MKREGSAPSLPIVHVVGTGGSISCIGTSRTDLLDYNYGARHYTIDEMIAHVPELRQIASLRSEQFMNAYGGEVSPERWVELARRINAILREAPETAGIAITHGTSTLEETAYFLNLTVKTRKPIVMTGAMRPMTAMSNDAELNLFDCVRVAATEHAGSRGVLVVLNNQIQAAREVTKTSTSRLDTFKSADLGFLGYADSDGEVVFYRDTTRLHTYRTEFNVEGIKTLPRVEIAFAYAGVDGTAVAALAQAGCKGLVAAGLGSGGAPRPFLDALGKVTEAGVPVVVTSQAGSGRAMARRAAAERGFLFADNLLPRKARILLMLALTCTGDPAQIQRMLKIY
ncbi:MAG: asparaginase [Betaproteobacteria bacterium]|nr:asparaginase [Betaproteobacteria bacterium]